ncbi:DNA polymerase III subunit delta [Shouchella patagoniensis]|uniref:DNA polymerase III subunit delta n=1 Tax=Shouchella patagoniensis TaxID=228576 RepID=UPI000994BCAA|nr:DNA polymerase III subunit delta [Shouchella patagoniensis]
MSVTKIMNDLSTKTLKPIYFLYGTEQYLIEQFLQNVHEVLFTEDDGELNDVRFYLADTPLEQIIEEAETVPFFSTRKLVVIQDFYLATSQKPPSKIEHNVDSIEAYVNEPASETVLVIVAPYEKLDERKRITKRLKKEVEAIDVSPLSEENVYKWIQSIMKKEHFEIETEAKELMFQRVGANLMLMHQELNKCMLYAKDVKRITKTDVANMVAETVEQSIFTVIEFAAKGQAGKAVHTYHGLLRQKEEPLAILALLTRQFRIFYQVKVRASKGYTQKEIASQLKVHPYVIKLAMQKMKSFSIESLRLAIIHCSDTDYGIKSGRLEKEMAVELLLIRLSEAG